MAFEMTYSFHDVVGMRSHVNQIHLRPFQDFACYDGLQRGPSIGFSVVQTYCASFQKPFNHDFRDSIIYFVDATKSFGIARVFQFVVNFFYDVSSIIIACNNAIKFFGFACFAI